MNDEQKREYAEAIKHALGMGYGPPMEGEEGWVPPAAMAVEDADDEDAWDVLYADVERTAKERADPDYHSPDDGRGPRRVFVDGVEVHKVVLAAHVSGGFIRVAEEGRPPGGVGRYVTGKVEVVPMTVEDADDEDFDATAQAIMDELREKKERRMAEERAKAAEPKPKPPSDDPWAVIGKAEDDGERIMDITRNFG